MEKVELRILMELIDSVFEKLARKSRTLYASKLLESLTVAEADCLFAISKDENPTMKLISERLGVASNTATVSVDRLVMKDLVYREAGALDRRQIFVKFTDKGKKVVAQLEKLYTDEFLACISPLSESEIMMLKALLEKVDRGL